MDQDKKSVGIGNVIGASGARRLQTRIFLGMSAAVLLLGIAVIGYVKFSLTSALHDKLTKRGVVIAQSAAQSAAHHILTEQDAQLVILLKSLVEDQEDVRYAFVADDHGVVRAHTFQDGFPSDLVAIDGPPRGKPYGLTPLDTEDGPLLDIAAPVLGGDAGILHVGFSREVVQRGVNSVVNPLIAIVTAALFTVLGIASFFAKQITRPLHELVASVQAVRGGDLSRKVKARTRDEIGLLARAFNEMTEKLSTTLVSRNELEQAYQFQKTVINSMRDPISIIDTGDYRIVDVNDCFCREVKRERAEVIGRTCHEVTHDSAEPCAGLGEECPLQVTVHTREHAEAEHIHTDGAGNKVHAEIHTSPVVDGNGRVAQVVHIVRDVTERRKAEERIKHLAYYDSLTNLPNRLLYREIVDRALIYAERYKKLMAVIYVDLDAFKRINDTLGREVGDLLLKTVADRIVISVRKSDYVGKVEEEDLTNAVSRVGGDEFVVLLTDIGHTEDAARVAMRLTEQLSQPLDVGRGEMYITASVGISIYPHDGSNAEDLIRTADVAMFHAKKLGKNTYQFFTEAMNQAAVKRLDIENDLHRALDRREFFLLYQPKVNVKTGAVASLEALIRWRHPEKGMISPADFISIAEETGLIVPIGEWVLRTACIQCAEWRSAGLGQTTVSVNLSNRQFMQRDLVEAVTGIFYDLGAQPGDIELEITESAVMQSPEAAVATLREIRRLGITIAIDDFGTGYSSFGLLRRLPLDFLKIDRSFITPIAANKDDAAIVSAIISMAHSLGLKVVAEGVETEEQLAVLRSLGCDEVQGYLFSRPVPAEECVRFLKEGFRKQK